MSESKDKELSLDELKDASGGATAIEYGLIAWNVANPDKAELDKSSTKKDIKGKEKKDDPLFPRGTDSVAF